MKSFMFCILILLLMPLLVLAHPHTFITTKLGVEFEEDRIKGVWVDWEFDEMFSSVVIEDADLDRNNKFDEQELKIVYEDAFSNVKDYDYFFYRRKGRKRFPAKKVEQFSARINKDKLSYRFFIPMEKVGEELILSIFDPTFYCATSYARKKPVYFLKPDKVRAKYKIVENKKYPIYYNPAGAADDMTTYDKWQPGLETAYPEEVIITFSKK